MGSIIRYDGVHGITWRIKYRDADGKQIMETVGRERDGVTRAHAKSLLQERDGTRDIQSGPTVELNLRALRTRIRSIQDEAQAIQNDLLAIEKMLTEGNGHQGWSRDERVAAWKEAFRKENTQ